jgi:hypothetical protein
MPLRGLQHGEHVECERDAVERLRVAGAPAPNLTYDLEVVRISEEEDRSGHG